MTTSILTIGLFVSILTNVVFALAVIRRLRASARAVVTMMDTQINDLGDGLIMPVPDDPRWIAERKYKTIADSKTIYLLLGGIKLDPQFPEYGIEVAGLPDAIKNDRATAYIKAVSIAYTQSKIAAAALSEIVGT